MQKKDVDVVEFATYVFTCGGCADELHIKKATSEDDALDRVGDSGWAVYDNSVLCQKCKRRFYGDDD